MSQEGIDGGVKGEGGLGRHIFGALLTVESQLVDYHDLNNFQSLHFTLFFSGFCLLV